MASKLIITTVENLQPRINGIASSLAGKPGVYVSLNKTQKSVEEIFKAEKIDTRKMFFIDCVTSEQTKDYVLHIRPTELDKLSFAINSFFKEIKGEKYLIIDALSTLLIYNNENKVAAFVKEITEYASANNITVVALSPETKGEELLDKIFNFFNEVLRK
jgi:archaellum biogenesis ATPase FlaH